MPRLNPAAPALTGAALRVTVITTNEGIQCFTDHDYQTLAAFVLTPTNVLAFSTAWQTLCLSAYLACLTPDSQLAGVRVTDISQGTVPTLFDQTNLGDLGTEAGHNLPIEVAAVISKRTALKGQHGIGRYSMPAVPVAFTTPATASNNINSTGIGAYAGLDTALLLPVSASAQTWVPIVSTRPKTPATLVTHAAIITSFLIRAVLGTIRRRKPGRGI